MKHKPSSFLNSTFISSGLAFLGICTVFLSFRFSNSSSDLRYIMIIAVACSGLAAFYSILYSRIIDKRRKRKNIFIIYSRLDRGAVANIVNKLKERGYNPWVDFNDILPGQIWSEAIRSAIQSSAVAIYVISKNSQKEPSISKELDIARNELHTQNQSFSPIIPVKIDESDIPVEVKDIQYVDINDEMAFDLLDRSLGKILGMN